VQQKWQVTNVAMAHRTGTVKVCEASVIIAVSSPHRQAALQVRPHALSPVSRSGAGPSALYELV
jgi:molybdopterin synthase catalytic subunit